MESVMIINAMDSAEVKGKVLDGAESGSSEQILALRVGEALWNYSVLLPRFDSLQAMLGTIRRDWQKRD
jgi:hypothetical protein